MKSMAVFDHIRARISSLDEKMARNIGVFQINIRDPTDIHQWVIDLVEQEVYEGVSTNPDIIIQADDDVFYLVAIKRVTVDAAIDKGDLEVQGDKELVNKLIDLLESTEV